MEKLLLVTEYLNPPYDEGIKKTVYNLYRQLEDNYQLYTICRYGFKSKNIDIIDSNPLFLSAKIYKKIRNFKPAIIIYFPFASSTFASYLRLTVLKYFARNSKSIFIALQPKTLKKWQFFFISYLKPDYALTPSPLLKKLWDTRNINSSLIPLLTDITTFKPLVDDEDKKQLRLKYNLPLDKFIITHMGHLNEGRNLRALIPLQKEGNQVVIILSSSTPKDAQGPKDLKSKLEREGIIVLDQFIENIEEVYQLSDLYVFPVVSPNSSIGMPLSILEARACGIPVITTDFGSLRKHLGYDNEGIIYSEPDQFLSNLIKIKKNIKNDFKSNKIKNLNNILINELNLLLEE